MHLLVNVTADEQGEGGHFLAKASSHKKSGWGSLLFHFDFPPPTAFESESTLNQIHIEI